MDNIYMLNDADIVARLSSRLKTLRLRQNMSQQRLATDAGISLSSVIRIENGEIKSFDTLLRILRTLGKLEILSPLTGEERLTPNEYYLMQQAAKAPVRKRAAKSHTETLRDEPSW